MNLDYYCRLMVQIQDFLDTLKVRDHNSWKRIKKDRICTFAGYPIQVDKKCRVTKIGA
jgi:hypothetical protein